MFTTFTDKVENDYIQMGQDAEFARGKNISYLLFGNSRIEGLGILRRQFSEQVELAKPCERRQNVIEPDIDMGTLDDTWPLLWTDDLLGFSNDTSNESIPNMYLLGLPHVGMTE
jgi:hypothetical protein